MESNNLNICPLCQNANGCGLQAGKSIYECWCQINPFPIKEHLSELERINLNKACICQECADRLQKLAKLKVKEIG